MGSFFRAPLGGRERDRRTQCSSVLSVSVRLLVGKSVREEIRGANGGGPVTAKAEWTPESFTPLSVSVFVHGLLFCVVSCSSSFPPFSRTPFFGLYFHQERDACAGLHRGKSRRLALCPGDFEKERVREILLPVPSRHRSTARE